MKTLLFLCMLVTGMKIAFASVITGEFEPAYDRESRTADENTGDPADSIAPDQTGMRNLTSVELSKKMVPGWNVGNSLEAIGGETKWGNPLITQQLIDSVKSAGFKAIRIPVAWSRFTDAENFIIDTTWMNRVEEVVNYALADSLYAMINIHWDGGWMQPTYSRQEYVNNRLAVIWNQIAVHFRDYDDRLLFAGTNEVMVDGDYGTPIPEYYTVQNSFNQTFVSTVRSTGGRNYYRHLVVQGFNTNINNTVSFFTIPFDPAEDRLMVEVHYYDPYNFALNTSSNITQWGKYATNPSKTETWANEIYADNQFQKMKTKFVDQGFGVVLGEYGAVSRTDLGSAELNAEYAMYRRYYIESITQSIVKKELVPFYWDNGHTGNHAFGLFNRFSNTQAYPDLIRAIMRGCDTDHVVTYAGAAGTGSVLLYPNPAREILNLAFGDINIHRGELYDANGQMVRILTVEKGMNTYMIHDLKAGLYFVKLFSSDGIIVRKFMKN